MLRSAVRVIGLSGALLSSGVFALGLGDMKLYSAVNEPLRAEIKLLKVGDLNTSQVLIKLASLQDFERANVERDFFLTGMRYEVELDGRGGGVVKVSTEEPVREPYLNFLLEAKWPSGRLVREYTLLLDLPAFTSTNDSQSAAVQAPQSEPEPAAISPPAPQPRRYDSEPGDGRQISSAAPVPTPSPVVRDNYGADSYTTQRSDTLWKIAQQSRPSNRVTVNQTMIALQRENPQAFINGNINRLKVGEVLRLPDERRVLDIANEQASLEVARQMQEWRSADDEVRQLDARSGAVQQAPTQAGDTRGTLKLSTAAGAGINGDPDGSADAEVAALNARLTDVLAELGSTQAENTELNQRVQELLSEMESLKNKLEIRNSQLAQVQAQTGMDDTELQFEEVPEAATTPEMAQDAEFDSIAANEEDSFSADPEEALQESSVVDEATQPTVAAEPEPSWLDRLLSPLWLAVLAIVALLGGVFWWRRRNSEEEYEYVTDDTGAAAPSVATAVPAAAASERNDLDTTPAFSASAAEQPILEEEEAVEQVDRADASAIEAEMGDPIAEADIYVAYGRYPQAIELLNRAIEQEPERTDLVAKLVEVHSAAGDRDAAAEQLAKLESMGASESAAEPANEVPAGSDLASANDDAPDVMEEFRDNLPEESAEQFSAEFAGEESTVDQSLIDSILGDEDDHDDGDQNEMSLEDDFSIDEEADLGSFAIGDVAQASNTDSDLLEEEFDLELDLDLDQENDLENAADALDAGDVRQAFAEGNELSDGNFASANDIQAPEDLEEFSAEFIADDSAIGMEQELADIDSSLSDPELDDLSALDELELDSTDDDMDLAAELSSLDVSIEDEATNTIVSNDLQPANSSADELELDMEQASLSGDGSAEHDADVAMLEADETATKLDLARAYIDMGDTEGARDILGEVMEEGTALDKQQAKELLDRIA